MDRKRRACPVFGCGSTNLVRLANHLDQIHHMDIKERAKWLKWSKIGLRVPLQSEDTAADNKEINLENTLESILKRQEDMETNFNNFLRTTRIQSGDSATSYSKQPTLEKSKRPVRK